MTDPVLVGLIAGTVVGVLLVVAEGPHRVTAVALPLVIACTALAIPYDGFVQALPPSGAAQAPRRPVVG